MALGTAAKLSRQGTVLKPFFTITAATRYACVMFLLAAAAIVTAVPDSGPRPSSAVRQATATVRIIAAARIKLGEEPSAQGLPPRRSRTVQTAQGPQPALLIEFE